LSRAIDGDAIFSDVLGVFPRVFPKEALCLFTQQIHSRDPRSSYRYDDDTTLKKIMAQEIQGGCELPKKLE